MSINKDDAWDINTDAPELMSYTNAIAWATEQVMEEYTIEELQQLAFDNIYSHFNDDFDSLIAYCEQRGVQIVGD